MGILQLRPSFVVGHWISRLLPLPIILILFWTVSQEYITMRTNPRSSFIAAIAASLARHGKAATVDLSWHAPNATAINNLTQVIGGTGVYGFIYNNSEVPAHQYGIYDWCNMPHVRATEYKKPSSEYKLQYVEVVCC
jgi:hypothetical protein